MTLTAKNIEAMFEQDFYRDGLTAIEAYFTKLAWYLHHMATVDHISAGVIYLVPDDEFDEFIEIVPWYSIRESEWNAACEKSKAIAEDLGLLDNDCSNDFDAGKIDGKLAVIRWKLGITEREARPDWMPKVKTDFASWDGILEVDQIDPEDQYQWGVAIGILTAFARFGIYFWEDVYEDLPDTFQAPPTKTTG